MSNPFYREGEDLYEKDGRIRFFVGLFQLLFVLGAVVYVGVFIHNFPFKHTYTENPGNPGILISDRYTFGWVITMLSAVTYLAMLYLIHMWIITRKHFGWSTLMFVLYLAFFCLLVLILVFFSITYAGCNAADAPQNMCNDYKWCCVHALDHCPTYINCPGVTESDLVPKREFTTIFWANVAMVGLHAVFLIVVLLYWSSPMRAEKEPVYEHLAAAPMPKKTQISTNISHGLREDSVRQRKINE